MAVCGGWGDHYYCCNAIDAIIIRKFVLQHYPCSGRPPRNRNHSMICTYADIIKFIRYKYSVDVDYL